MAFLEKQGWQSDRSGLPSQAIANMSSAASWLKFLGITGIIVLVIYTIAFCRTLFAEFSLMIHQLSIVFSDLGAYAMFGFMILALFFSFYLSILLYQKGKAISDVAKTESNPDLERFFALQKQFWRILAIFTIIIILFYILLIFVVLYAPPGRGIR